MKTLAIMNAKGGTAKTTTAVCLSACLARRGKRVLLIDVDHQGAASSWVLDAEQETELADVLTGAAKLEDAITQTPFGFSIIPSSARLAVEEKALAKRPLAELMLRRRLEGLDGYDYVLLDCPPNVGLLTTQALAAAQGVLVPVECEVLAVRALKTLADFVEIVEEQLSTGLSILGVIPTKYDARLRIARDVMEILHEQFGGKVLPAIRADARAREAPAFRQPLEQFAPTCRAAEDYRALADHLLKRRK